LIVLGVFVSDYYMVSNVFMNDEQTSFQWYVVCVTAGAERKVKQTIEEHALKSGLESSFAEILIPSVSVTEMRRGNKIVVEKKIMPGYLFVHMDMSDKSARIIEDIPEVFRFLGGNKPNVVKLEEIQRIRDAIENQAQTARSDAVFEVGDMVQILEGPFESFKGQIDSVNEKESKIVVVVSIFGNDTRITLSMDHIKRA
jgi:transcriptional antiterminator NusG